MDMLSSTVTIIRLNFEPNGNGHTPLILVKSDLDTLGPGRKKDVKKRSCLQKLWLSWWENGGFWLQKQKYGK